MTDLLPKGLTYVEGSLTTNPPIGSTGGTEEGPSVATPGNAPEETPGESTGETATAATEKVSEEGQGRQKLTITLPDFNKKTTVTFSTKVDPELLGFNSNNQVKVENTITMTGTADDVEFSEVSSKVSKTFSNHGLVKGSTVDNDKELIQYDVLINPYHLSLPQSPKLIDTMDKRLQLDTDSLMFYEAELLEKITDAQKPGYTKKGEGTPLTITSYDLEKNSFTVTLPIEEGDTRAYVLSYTADILVRENGGYSNRVSFDGGSVMLGGDKNNSASVSGGGGGGGGGVASRKASIIISKKDYDTGNLLADVGFTLYQCDNDTKERGLPFAQNKTDEDGSLSFKVSPGNLYELVETEPIPGYSSKLQLDTDTPPDGVEFFNDRLLIMAAAAGKNTKLQLTNQANTMDIVFRLFNQSGIPMAGTTVELFEKDPNGEGNPSPFDTAKVLPDGTISLSGRLLADSWFIRLPDGRGLTVRKPSDSTGTPLLVNEDGSESPLTKDTSIEAKAGEDKQWKLTVTNVLDGAEYGLYADEACRILLKTFSLSEGTGKTAVVEGLMEGQTYWLKELKAPDGYLPDSTLYRSDANNPSVLVENIPDTSDDSGNTGGSGGSSGSGSSGGSDGSGDTGGSGGSSASSGSGNSSYIAGLPKTGERVPWFFVTAVLSGALLMLMSLYELMRLKNRKEKQ